MRTRNLFLAVCLTITLTGCAARTKNVTNLPAGVTLKQAQDWDSAIANLHKVASTVSTLRQTLTDVHNSGVLSNEYYADGLRAIAHVDQLELSAENVLRQSPQNFSLATKQKVNGFIQQIIVEIEHLNEAGTTGIKNANSLKQVDNLLAEMAAVVNIILAL